LLPSNKNSLLSRFFLHTAFFYFVISRLCYKAIIFLNLHREAL